MAELIEITRALEKVERFTPLQRILLLSAGTLQGTLSAFFGKEILVRVTQQSEDANHVIHRSADLHDRNVVVCTAESQIEILRADIRAEVMAGTTGIGQVLEMHGIRPSFELDRVEQDDRWFHRLYVLRAPGVVYHIRETFPQILYRVEGWPDPP